MTTLRKGETVRTDRNEIGTIVRFRGGWVVVLVPGIGRIVVPPQSLETMPQNDKSPASAEAKTGRAPIARVGIEAAD